MMKILNIQFVIQLVLLCVPIYGHAQPDFESFKGEKIPFHQQSWLDESYFHEYHPYKNSKSQISKFEKTKDTPKNAIANILIKKNIPDSLIIPIRLVHKLTFKHKNVKTCIVKYYEENLNKEKKVFSIVLQNIDKEWHKVTLPEIKSIRYVIEILQPSAFMEFYSKKNNPKYQEINSLKSLVQNEKGILNIDKLALVLKANKNKLSEYLDQ